MAYHLYRKHHMQFNNMYWAYLYGVATLGREAKSAKQKYNLPQEYFVNFNAQHVNYSAIESWASWWGYFEDFENLTRINLLLDANSYFEIYMRSIYCLAMESRPDVLLDRATVVDGLKLYKANQHYHYTAKREDEYIFADNLSRLTKGDWAKRIDAFNEIFGTTPLEMIKNRDELNKIRKIRNEVGHFFGRPKNNDDGTIRLSLDNITRLSDQYLKKLIGVMYECANGIDKMLFTNFIGSYESILFCLQCADKAHIPHTQNRIGDIVNIASQEMGSHGYTVNHNYLREALDHYFQ